MNGDQRALKLASGVEIDICAAMVLNSPVLYQSPLPTDPPPPTHSKHYGNITQTPSALTMYAIKYIYNRISCLSHYRPCPSQYSHSLTSLPSVSSPKGRTQEETRPHK